MLEVKPVRLHDRLDTGEATAALEIMIDREEDRGMDVALPAQEPIGREGQHALGRRCPLCFFVKREQSFAAHSDLCFEHGNAGAALDERDRKIELFYFANRATVLH